MGFMEPQVWRSVFVDVAMSRWDTEPVDLMDHLMFGPYGRGTFVDGRLVLSKRNRARVRMGIARSLDVDPSAVDMDTLRRGWGAMLSAPGYMDRTDLTVHDSEQEAEDYLREMYDDEEHDMLDGPRERLLEACTCPAKLDGPADDACPVHAEDE